MRAPGIAETSAFIAVVEQRSFTKAAKLLGLSPARVSEMVRKTEDQLGVRLIERTTRSVAPTVVGERLVRRMRAVMSDYEAALDATRALSGKPAGSLRLTVAPPAADLILATIVPDFLALHPEISIEMVEDSALTDIVAGRFDAGIRPGHRLSPGMVAARISDAMPVAVVGSPSYFAANGKPQTPRDLLTHDCIRFRLQNGVLFPWTFRINGRTMEMQVEGRLIVTGQPMARGAALAGAGILQTPLPYVAADLAAGRLISVLEEWPPMAIDGFYLYYPKSRQTRPALKALADFLRATHAGSSASRTRRHSLDRSGARTV